jgi:hypothetical protein
VGGPFSPTSVTYTLTNSGGTTLDWEAGPPPSWVSVSASSGTLVAGASTTVVVSLNTNANALNAGSYSEAVGFRNLSTGAGDTTRAVALTVNSPGVLGVSPADGLTAVGTVGGPFSPTSVTYTLTNAGGSSLEWTTSKTADWLDLSASAGTLEPGDSAALELSINANAGILAVGTYHDAVTVAAGPTENAAFLVTVTLEVAAPPEFIAYGLTNPNVLQMVVKALAGTEIVLEASADLEEWTSVATNRVAVDGTVSFSEPVSADSPKRCYRARALP